MATTRMCEALVWRVSRGAWDAGDVIDVCADGHEWGRMELGNPDWQVITLPGDAQAYADMLHVDIRNGVFWRQRARHFVNGEKVTKPVPSVVRI